MIFALLVYRMMKSPTTTQRTMWVCFFFFFPLAYLPRFHFSPRKHTGHTQTWDVICFCYTAPSLSLVLPFTSSSSLLSSISLFLFATFMPCFFHPGFLSLPQPFCCNPSLFCLLSRLFFQSSFLSVIPPPTPSQVKRFLPCFSSNWQMRCMSWLHCCFIRK